MKFIEQCARVARVEDSDDGADVHSEHEFRQESDDEDDSGVVDELGDRLSKIEFLERAPMKGKDTLRSAPYHITRALSPSNFYDGLNDQSLFSLNFADDNSNSNNDNDDNNNNNNKTDSLLQFYGEVPQNFSSLEDLTVSQQQPQSTPPAMYSNIPTLTGGNMTQWDTAVSDQVQSLPAASDFQDHYDIISDLYLNLLEDSENLSNEFNNFDCNLDAVPTPSPPDQNFLSPEFRTARECAAVSPHSQFGLNPSPQSIISDLDDTQLPATVCDLKRSARAELRQTVVDKDPEYKKLAWLKMTFTTLDVLVRTTDGLNQLQRMARSSRVDATLLYACVELKVRRADPEDRDKVAAALTAKPTVLEILALRNEALLARYVAELMQDLGVEPAATLPDLVSRLSRSAATAAALRELRDLWPAQHC